MARPAGPAGFSPITEAKGTEPAPAWTKLKKAELAQIAATQVAGTGWLPDPLRIADAAPDDESVIDADGDIQSEAA